VGTEQCHTIFDDVNSQQQDGAWALSQYLLQDNDFVLPAWGSTTRRSPASIPSWTTSSTSTTCHRTSSSHSRTSAPTGTSYSNTGGPWDVWPTDPIRWTDINETLSQAIAGQHSAQETPSLIRERVLTRLEQQQNN